MRGVYLMLSNFPETLTYSLCACAWARTAHQSTWGAWGESIWGLWVRSGERQAECRKQMKGHEVRQAGWARGGPGESGREGRDNSGDGGKEHGQEGGRARSQRYLEKEERKSVKKEAGEGMKLETGRER